jgi:hypothetical protein
MKTHTFRLKPQQDLFDSIEGFVKENNIEAGCVLSSVGSLTHATLRLANRGYYNEYDGHFDRPSLDPADDAQAPSQHGAGGRRRVHAQGMMRP